MAQIRQPSAALQGLTTNLEDHVPKKNLICPARTCRLIGVLSFDFSVLMT
jgi:hypothetical protein